MDNSKVKIKNTTMCGKGVFASELIKKGDVIADWSGGIIYNARKCTLLPNKSPDFVRDHAIQFSDEQYVDYGGMGRYLNHSCDPNCGFNGKFKIITMKNIKKDEELTFDYGMCEDSDWRMECKCGSKRCRK